MHIQAPNRLLKNSLFNLLSWGGNAVINLVSIPVIVYYLGAEGYGIYALLTGLIGYYSLLDLGLGQGVVKYVAEFAGQNDKEGVKEAINTALVVQLLTGLAGLLILTVWNRGIIELLNIGPARAPEASLCLYISSFGFFVTMVMGTFSSALLGLQRFDTVGKVNMTFSIMTTFLIVASLALGGTLFHVILLSVATTALNCFLFIFLVHRNIPSYRPSLLVRRQSFKTMISYSSYLFTLKLSSFLNTYFVRFIIGALWGPQAVAYFVVPMKLVAAVQGGLGSLSGVLFPRSSDLFARGSLDELHKLYLKSSRYLVAASTPLFLSLVVFSGPIMSVWMGKEFAHGSWLVLVFLGVAHWLAALTMIPSNIIMGIGKSRVVAVFSTVAAALNLIFVFALARSYGADGAAAGVMITAIQGPLFIWYVTTRILKIPWQQFTATVLKPQTRAFVGYIFLITTVLLVQQRVFDVGSVGVLLLAALAAAFYMLYLFKAGILDWKDLVMRKAIPAAVE